MARHRTLRPAAPAQVLLGLAALPLVLTTSSVGISAASADHAPEAPPAVETRWLQATPSDDVPSSTRVEAVPASFTTTERVALGKARAADIPWVALQAYQRAANILAEVEESCGLSWPLLAAIGQVESEHGQAADGVLGDDGVVRPAFVGELLDGRGGRPEVPDSDDGELDGDETWDRAVGPMQLLPHVWEIAGVDGDGDGNRSPQDIDDAALAAGVYLCATGSGLDQEADAAAALSSYNPRPGYAEQVLSVAAHYAEGEFGVAGAPAPQSIGRTLDHGPGASAVRESERALREAAAQPDQESTVAAGAGTPPATRPDTGPADRPAQPARKPAGGEEPAASGSDDQSKDEPGPRAPAEETESRADGPTDPEETEPAEETEETEEPAAGGQDGAGESTDESEKAAEQETVTMKGIWSACGDGYCLDTLLLDLAEAGEPRSPAAADIDGDGTTGTVEEELAGLVGRAVELTVLEGSDPLVVVAVDGVAVGPDPTA